MRWRGFRWRTLLAMPDRSRRRALILASAAVVLFAAGWIGLSILDSILLKEARAQANAFSQKIGHPIAIGDVSTKIFFRPSVRISGVEVGPGQGEKLPLLALQALEVKPALLTVLLSRGKQLEIDSATVEGLAINVVRFPDGTTNLERLQSKLAEEAKPEQTAEKKEQQQEPAQPLNLIVNHFALNGGRIRFVDQGQALGRAGETDNGLEIRNVELRVDNLRAEKPLNVSLKAAILAEHQNFELDMATAPLPASLVPTPKSLTLKVQPIDLKPIAPYLPRSIGLEAGKLTADLTADLGAVAPGGKGEARLRGGLSALGLRFAGAEAGSTLDISLDADVKGNASKGDVQIDRLKLDIGPARIDGQGRVLGLASGQPRVEGLEVVAHDLDPARIAALCPPLQRQLKGQIAGPIGLAMKGSGTEASQAIEIKLDLTPVRLAIPEMLSKAPGKTMTLVAQLRGAAAGALRFDFQADLSGADLRPGESLDKPPEEPLTVSISGTKSGAGEKGAPLKIQLSEVAARIRDSTFNGSGSLEASGSGKDKKNRFELSVHSPRLDLDKLLLSSKKEKPPLDPSLFAGVRGHAAVKIDSLRKSKIDFNNVVADVKMVDDELTLQTLSMGGFGGRISANGTTIRLAQRKMPFHLIAQAQNIDVLQALRLTTERKVLAGTMSGDLNFSGAGTETADLLHSLSGTLESHLRDGKFLGKDLIASVAGPLAKALPPGLVRLKSEQGATSLGKDLALAVSVEKGFAKLKAPIQVSTPEAQIKLSGGAHLDGTLDMAGTIELAPSTLSSLTGGKVTPKEAIPIPMKIVGPAWSPSVTDLDLKAAVASIAKQAGSSVLKSFLGTGTGGSGERAQDKANREQQRARDAAGSAEEKARKQVEEKAQDLLKGLRRP